MNNSIKTIKSKTKDDNRTDFDYLINKIVEKNISPKMIKIHQILRDGQKVNLKLTGEDWSKKLEEDCGVKVLDPDGFRDGNCDYENTRISPSDFYSRFIKCTIIGV